jgi:hypothetical protein
MTISLESSYDTLQGIKLGREKKRDHMFMSLLKHRTKLLYKGNYQRISVLEDSIISKF